MKDKVVKKYIKALRKQIVFSGRKKKEYLSEIKMNLITFTESNPDADYNMLCESFGNPEDLAKEFMDNIDPAEYRKAVSKKRIISIFAIAAISIYIVAVIISLVNSHNSVNGYTVYEEYEYVNKEVKGE